MLITILVAASSFAPATSSPIISPAAIIRTLRNLAGKIGKRNAQVGSLSSYSSGGFGSNTNSFGSGGFGSNGGSFQPSYGAGFSDGTDFGPTFQDFGVSLGGGFNTATCTTVYEQQCSTVNEEQCSTVNEQQCR